MVNREYFFMKKILEFKLNHHHPIPQINSDHVKQNVIPLEEMDENITTHVTVRKEFYTVHGKGFVNETHLLQSFEMVNSDEIRNVGQIAITYPTQLEHHASFTKWGVIQSKSGIFEEFEHVYSVDEKVILF